MTTTGFIYINGICMDSNPQSFALDGDVWHERKKVKMDWICALFVPEDTKNVRKESMEV